MRFRKLRIAWSMGCLIACVLLIVLWVRSYWWMDSAAHNFSNKFGLIAYSQRGLVHAEYFYSRSWLNQYGTILNQYQNGSNGVEEGDDTIDTWAGFSFSTNRNFFNFVVPYWFLVLIMGTVATVPWLRWSKRFSLRALLIATSLVALVLGLIVVLSRQ